MNLNFDPKGDGLSKVLRDYQEEAMKFVWANDMGVTSRETWNHVNEVLLGKKTISRVSVINFLNATVEEGVLSYEEESGKGGYHRVYRPGLDESGFRKLIAETVISSLMRDFPKETREAIKSLKIK